MIFLMGCLDIIVLYTIYIKSEDIYHNLGFTLWLIAHIFSVTGKMNEKM